MALLTDLEQRLVDGADLDSVCGFKVVDHVGPCLLISVVEDIVLWVHIPLDLVYLVCSVRAILGHDDCTLKLSVDEICIVALASIIY